MKVIIIRKIDLIIELNFVDSFNAVMESIISFLTFVFGKHWFLFALFLFFNIIDWLTGWYKVKVTKKENSIKGWQCLLKKMVYWLMIIFAFSLSALFIELGHTFEMDLGITALLGWFVLAGLIVNEARSIIENFVEAGLKVPAILINGLEAAEQVINKINKKGDKNI